jgi:hypothetical protein
VKLQKLKKKKNPVHSTLICFINCSSEHLVLITAGFLKKRFCDVAKVVTIQNSGYMPDM